MYTLTEKGFIYTALAHLGAAPRVPKASDLQQARGSVTITGAPWAQGVCV
jgi:hypothetical protein